VSEPSAGDRVRAVFGRVPATTVAVAFVCYWLAAAGVRFDDVFVASPLNPFAYVANAVFHADWGHFAHNVAFWVPFSAALAWLTSDRHLLLVAVVSNALETLVGFAVLQYAVGLSGVVFAVAAATLVRATGVAFRDASTTTVQAAVGTAVALPLLGFLAVAVVAGRGPVAHFGHFFAFLFGARIEAVYVLAEHGREEAEEGGGGSPAHVPGRVE
jgi:membrane associated rhomboid family serine protease